MNSIKNKTSVVEKANTWKSEEINQEMAENYLRILALEDSFESLYDVDLETGRYEVFIKGETYDHEIKDKLLDIKEYFSDLKENIESVVYKEDREELLKVLSKESIIKNLAIKDSFEYRYRVMVKNEPVWFRIRVLYKNAEKRNVIIGVFNAVDEVEKQERLEQENQKVKRIISVFAREYEAALFVSMADGSYRILSNRAEVLPAYAEGISFDDVMDGYVLSYVSLEDSSLFNAGYTKLKYIKKHLHVGTSNSIEYRRRVDGEYEWYRVTFHRVNDDDLLVGFNNCNLEVKNRIVTEKLIEPYDGIFLAYLDKDEVQPIRASRVSTVGDGNEVTSYRELATSFSKVVAPDYKQDWINFGNVAFMKQYLRGEDHREYVFELPETRMAVRRVTLDVIERKNGEASVVLFSFVGIDEARSKTIRLHKQMAEQKIWLDYFVESYSSAFFANLENDTIEMIHMDSAYAGIFKMNGSRRDMLKFIDNHIHEDDKKMMRQFIDREYLVNRLRKEKSISFSVREVFDDVQRTMRGLIVRGTDEYHIAVGFLDITEEVEEEQREQEKLQQAESLKSIVDGFAEKYETVYIVNSKKNTYKVLKGRKELYDAWGGSAQFTMTFSKYIDSIYESDKPVLRKEFKLEHICRRMTKEKDYTVNYRSLFETGYPVWCEARFLKINEDEFVLAFVNADIEMSLKLTQKAVFEDCLGIYIADLNMDTIKVVKKMPFDVFRKKNVDIDIYSKILPLFIGKMTERYQADWNKIKAPEGLISYLGKEDKRELIFELKDNLGRLYRCNCYVLERVKEIPLTVCITFSELDEVQSDREKLNEKIAEQSVFTGYFLQPYTSAYYLDLDTGIAEVYKNSGKMNDNPDVIKDYFNVIKDFSEKACREEYKEELFKLSNPEFLRDIAKGNEYYSYIFVAIDTGTDRNVQVQVMRGVDENHVAIGFKDVTEELKNQEEIREKTEAADQFIRGFIKDYTLAYKVNLSEDSFVILKENEEFIGDAPEFKCFNDVINYLTNEIVFEPDRNLVKRELNYARIRKRLSLEKSYTVEYRVFVGGISIWNAMTICLLDDNYVAFGFTADNEKIILRYLQEKENDDYFALFSVDMDTGLITVLRRNPIFVVGEVGESELFEVAAKEFAKRQEGEVRDYFMRVSNLKNLKKDMAYEDKNTFSYQTDLPEGKKWITVTSYVVARHEDGTPSVITFGFGILDTLGADRQELQNQIAEQNAFTRYFLEPFQSAYYVGLEDHSIQVYKRTSELEENYPIGDSYIDSLISYIDNEVRPEDRAEFKKIIQPQVMKEKLIKQGEFYYIFKTNKDGIEKNIRLQILRGADENHAAFGFREITNELREEQKQQDALKSALAMAESANRAKTTFLNNMSHDIRTPMNAIIGYAALASKHIDNKDRVNDYLMKIGQSSNHLLSLINDVLDMSRIESGKMNIEEKPENLGDIIVTIRDIVQADMRTKGHDFLIDTVNVRDENIFCDKLRLNQVLLNVLSNSIKYTPEGGTISMRIMERNVKLSGYATYEFTIKDNGMGMDEEYLKTLFEPFTRVKSSTVSGIQGTGLGMAITKNIVDMMGGKIEVRSTLGKGTEMTITLEFKLQEMDKKASIKESQDGFNFVGKKLLLVEDNELNREIATEILKDAGFIIDTAEDGDIAVDKIKNASPGDYDIILMDIQMPKMDGYHATKEIRELNTEVSKIPILAMTANAFEEDRLAAFDAGMNEHIAKPINVNKLKETLAKFL